MVDFLSVDSLNLIVYGALVLRWWWKARLRWRRGEMVMAGANVQFKMDSTCEVESIFEGINSSHRFASLFLFCVQNVFPVRQ